MYYPHLRVLYGMRRPVLEQGRDGGVGRNRAIPGEWAAPARSHLGGHGRDDDGEEHRLREDSSCGLRNVTTPGEWVLASTLR